MTDMFPPSRSWCGHDRDHPHPCDGQIWRGNKRGEYVPCPCARRQE